MHGLFDRAKNVVTALNYLDQYNEIEYIYSLEGLCSIAGCKCVDGNVICNNFDYIYFNERIHHTYSLMCRVRCGCEQEDLERPSIGNTRSNASIDVLENSNRTAGDVLSRIQTGVVRV